MKKKILILFVACTVIIFSACTKYEEGGYASKNRIVGTWTISELNLGGVIMDVNNLANGDAKLSLKNIVFNKDGSGSINYSASLLGSTLSYSNDFNWGFSDDKKNIKITSSSEIMTMLPEDSEILKLTKKEFKIKGNTNNTDVIITLNK